METTQKKAAVGFAPPKDVIKRVKKIAKRPIHYTEDCPKSTPDALLEFAALARSLRQKKKKPMIALRLEPETLEKYKSLGRGYTGIMADVLNYAAKNPEFLAQTIRC